MFGSGSKKASTSAAWTLQFLTTCYLVEGSLQPDEYKSGGQNIFEQASQSATDQGGADAFQNLKLTAATVRPTGPSAWHEQTFADWVMPTLDTTVAIIPRDPVSVQAAQRAFKDYDHAHAVTVFAGPYIIRGNLMSDSGDRGPSPFAMSELVAMTDAEIECPTRDAQMEDFSAPWILLKSTGFMHGYGIQ